MSDARGEYQVMRPFIHEGRTVEKGTIRMTRRQARHLVLNGFICPPGSQRDPTRKKS